MNIKWIVYDTNVLKMDYTCIGLDDRINKLIFYVRENFEGTVKMVEFPMIS